MIRELFKTGGLISTLAVAAVLASLGITRHQLLALFLVGVIEFYVWLRRHPSTLEVAADTYVSWLSSLVAVVSVALNPQLATQVVIIGVFIILRLADHLELFKNRPGTIALIMQFLSLSAIFSAAQVWRWSAAVVMVLAWTCSYLVARGFLKAMDDNQSNLLAGVWALVVAELSWILSWWMIAYLSPGAFLIIPQAALLVTGIAYVLGGIYRLHRTSQLSRNRLIEYLVVAGVLLGIVLAGTRWNGTA